MGFTLLNGTEMNRKRVQEALHHLCQLLILLFLTFVSFVHSLKIGLYFGGRQLLAEGERISFSIGGRRYSLEVFEILLKFLNLCQSQQMIDCWCRSTCFDGTTDRAFCLLRLLWIATYGGGLL
jgi:hypothetical protein